MRYEIMLNSSASKTRVFLKQQHTNKTGSKITRRSKKGEKKREKKKKRKAKHYIKTTRQRVGLVAPLEPLGQLLRVKNQFVVLAERSNTTRTRT